MRENDRQEVFLEEETKILEIAAFTPPEQLVEKLYAQVRQYHPSDDVSEIRRAYEYASSAHASQVRKSGEPYIIHPLSVAIILADLEMDKETIIAGLLHDVVEDTAVTQEDIARIFGQEVEELVDGVTKLDNIPLTSGTGADSDARLERQAENLRKMFLAMAKDIRVIIIKLADRLHNMRTLQYQKPESQLRIAKETMEVYSPIAMRLGISKIKIELDDLALMYLEPEAYRDLVEKINQRKTEREAYIAGIVEEVRSHIENAGIHAEVSGRVKHLFSIYKKMKNQDKTLDQIYDLFAVRIIVDDVKDCYAALGTIHGIYKPMPGRFKDYIAMPKANMYQSLHTTVIGQSGQPFEVQIRTQEMHKAAEYGIAAHWKYKEGIKGATADSNEDAKLSWLRQILDWQQDSSDNSEFMSLLKNDLDLFSDRVYCFTPNGDVKSLPAGSTTIDFAYSVHSAVGNRMVGARANGRLVGIDYRIQNGDRIEIITSQNSKGPSRDWLNIVRSTQAKYKINQWFKSALKAENIDHGKALLADYCKSRGWVLSDIASDKYTDQITRRYGFNDWNAVLAAIGHGAVHEGQIANKLQEMYDADHHAEPTNEEVLASIAKQNLARKPSPMRAKSGITVRGVSDVSVRFAKCCSPVPGDEIVGFVTRGKGITVHRTDCINVINLDEDDRQRLIEAQWDESPTKDGPGKFFAEIIIYADNRNGLLADVSRVFTDHGINILSVNTRTSKQNIATMQISFEISGREELNATIDRLRMVESVQDIERTTG